MKRYFDIDTSKLVQDFFPLWSAEEVKQHIETFHLPCLAVIEEFGKDDEDIIKEDLVEQQQTAGFHDAIEIRHALGCHFNHLLMWSILKPAGSSAASEPSGKLKELIEKSFTTYADFQQHFIKAVQLRPLPGWVWLGLLKDGNLIITQTNNEDNTLMHGIAMNECTPIFGIDLWEHAYIQKYGGGKDARAKYCETFLAALNWDKISANFETFNLNKKVAPILE